MIRLRIAGPNFEDIVAHLDRMAHPDLLPLAAMIKPIMIQDNRQGLLSGTDWNDDAMTPLEESTIRTRSGDGPPLIPRGESSPAIADYDVEIEPGTDRVLLIGGWRNTPYIHFHRTGFTVTRRDGTQVGVPSRDPTGIRAEGQTQIAVALNEFASALIGGAP